MHITADWQAVRLPNGDVGRIRQDLWEARFVQIDDGKALRGWDFLRLPKAALRGYRPYVPADYPAWRYHPPTMTAQLVQSAEEAAALGPNWVASPAEYGIVTHPMHEASAAGQRQWRVALSPWRDDEDDEDDIDEEIAAWQAQQMRLHRTGPSYTYHVSLRDPATFVDQEREDTAEAQWARLMTHFRRVIRTPNPWQN